MKLSTLSAKDLIALLDAKSTAVFENEAGIFPVQGATAAVLGHPLTQAFEVPLSGLNAAILGELLFNGSDGLRDRWIRLAAIVYWNGGRVLYRQAASGAFEASISY